MVGQGGNTHGHEPRRGLVDLAPRKAIDDARFPSMLVLDEAQELRPRVALVDDGVADIRAIEAGGEHARVGEPQSGDDLGARLRVRGCRQRDAGDLRIAFVQQRQLQIFGPEIVAPLRDAMRFVDREQCQLRSVQQIEAARGGQPLRRDVKEVELTREQRTLRGPRRVGALGVMDTKPGAA